MIDIKAVWTKAKYILIIFQNINPAIFIIKRNINNIKVIAHFRELLTNILFEIFKKSFYNKEY